MKIILLSGKASSGKTTTLNFLYDKITEYGKNHIISPKESLDKRDFEAVVEYNNKTVAIYSCGDVYYGIIEAIIKYAHCDVLILAYNNEHIQYPIDEFVDNHELHRLVKKHQAKTKNNQESFNKEDCDEILSKI